MLEIRDLGLSIEGKQILSDVSFSVEKGQLLAVCGPNGSGKTCLLKIIKGLLRQDSGLVVMDGAVLSPRQRLMETGLVFQDADIQIVGETVEKDIMFGPKNLGMTVQEAKERTEEVLELLGMQEYRKKRPQILSGGEKRCLAIAGVLAMKPSVILMDEPFSNLDYPSVRTVLKTILKLKEEGICLVLVSHDTERFLAHADLALVLDGGKECFLGSPQASVEIMRQHAVHVPAVPFGELSWL